MIVPALKPRLPDLKRYLLMKGGLDFQKILALVALIIIAIVANVYRVPAMCQSF